MKCIEFEDRLNEVLDLRLSPERDAVLQAHAEDCADCRELLLGQDQLFAGLQFSRRALAAPELGPRVLAEMRPAPLALEPLAKQPRRWNWPTLLASAAAVLLAVTFGVWVANRGTPTEAGVRNGKEKGAPEGFAAIKPGVSHQKPDKTKTQTLPPEIANSESSVVKSPSPSPALPDPDPNSEAYRQAMQSIAIHWPQAANWPHVDALNVQRVEHYAPSIRPIRESFEVALDALLKTLPGKKDTTRPTQPQALYEPEDLLHIA